MDFQVLQDQLLSLLKDNKLEDLFLEFDTKLARESDLQSLYLMIRNRYHRIKLDTTQGIISRQDENLEENKLVKDLHGFILMMEEDDLRKEEKKVSLEALLSEISEKERIMKSSTDENSQRLIRLGKNLIKLGKTLQEQPPPESGIPYVKYLQVGLKKGVRRMKIGYAELQQTYTLLLDSLKQIQNAYRELVTYLDNSQEDLDQEELERITLVSTQLKQSVQNLSSIDFEQVSFATVIDLATQVLSQKEKMGPELDFIFEYMTDMKEKSEDIRKFMDEFRNQLPSLIDAFQEVFIELELTVQAQKRDSD